MKTSQLKLNIFFYRGYKTIISNDEHKGGDKHYESIDFGWRITTDCFD